MSTAQEFLRRVEAIEDAVREIATATREVAQRVSVSSEAVPIVAELGREVSSALERLRSDVESLREQVARQAPGALEERVGRIPTEVGEAVGSRVRSSVDAVGERTAGALEGLRAAVSGLEERLASLVSGGSEATQTRVTAALEAVTTQLRSLEGRLEDAVAGAATATQERLTGALDALTSGVQAVEERLAEGLRPDALEPLEGLPDQLADVTSAVRDSLTEVAQTQGAVEQRLDAVRDQTLRRTDELETGLADALTGVAEAVREDQQRAAEHLAERVDELRAALRDDLEARLREVEAGMRAAIGERFDEAAARGTEAREAQERGLAQLRREVEQVFDRVVDPLGARVEGAVSSIREAVEGSIRDVMRRLTDVTPPIVELGERVQSVLESVDDFRSESGDLREALVQVHRVANALESIGRRRGLRELAETDRRVAEQQAALVDRLTSAGEVLTDRIGRLEEQLRAAIDTGELSRLQAEVTERIGAELENLRTSVAEEVGARISEAVTAVLESVRDQVAEAVPATVKEAVRTEAKEAMPGKTLTKDMTAIAKSQREIDRVVSGLRKDLDDVKKRIATWGKSRGAPRLAQELAAVEERVAEVESLVQEDLVEAVFERMQRVFDRRFDALVQLIDSRLQPTSEVETEQRRRRFRR